MRLKTFIKDCIRNRRIRKTHELDCIKAIVYWLPIVSKAICEIERDLDDIKTIEKIREKERKNNDKERTTSK